jgi:curli biogenesis system outer membrane secretion channel CsgG
MKKLIYLMVMIFCKISSVAAQDKMSIEILPFTYVENAASQEDVNSIQSTVTKAFVKTARFNVIDRSKLDLIRQERNPQRSEDIANDGIDQGTSNVSKYLITGHVLVAQIENLETLEGGSITSVLNASLNATLNEKTENVEKSEAASVYNAKLSFLLKIIDETTGQVMYSETIDPKSGNSMFGAMGVGSATPELAMTKAIKTIEDKIDEFVKINFPITFALVEIQEKDNKGMATKILIAGGNSFGLKKGDKLKIVESILIEVNGKNLERKKEIGEVRILKVEGENFSHCSVTSGGLEINARFNANAKLEAITK